MSYARARMGTTRATGDGRHAARPPPAAQRAERLAAVVVDALERGVLSDDLFDRLLSPQWRVHSAVHWTPVAAAEQAVRWLVGRGAGRVLDVGAGVGKLCVLGALLTEGVHFVGVEQRPALVDEARRIAALLGVAHRVTVRRATIEAIDPAEFDAFYLYNPFAEQQGVDDDVLIDGSVEADAARFAREVGLVERWLEQARHGTRVVTLHGFGGIMPRSYRLVAEREFAGDALDAWEQRLHESVRP